MRSNSSTEQVLKTKLNSPSQNEITGAAEADYYYDEDDDEDDGFGHFLVVQLHPPYRLAQHRGKKSPNRKHGLWSSRSAA